MERPEVPLEQTQEEITHHAHASAEPWIMGVALTTALLAVFAAVTALLAEHHANEAMIDQIRSSDQWNFYQAKSIKENIIANRIQLLAAFGKNADPKDSATLNRYKEEQAEIERAAREKEESSESHLRRHSALSRSVTMFQVAIAIGAISVLTRRRSFWIASLAFGVVGVGFLGYGLLGT